MTDIIISTASIVIGFLLDLIFGDPYNIPHPVRFIGNLIVKVERAIRKVFKGKHEYLGGVVLTLVVTSVSTIIPLIILIASHGVSPYLRLCIESIMCYQLLATKSLKVESMKVYYELEKKDLEAARNKLSMIVGRDTEYLDESQVAKAAVETVAENTSDGIIAPLFYMAIGGAHLGFLYKSINTMDSMVGYKNEKYINLGRFSAKLDDIVNYIPARISAIIMIMASFLLGLDYKGAYRIFRRDRYNHKSPNSAQTESVCAGALNIELAGDAYYFGELFKKPSIGDDIRKIKASDIILSNRLMYATSILSLIIFIGIKIYFLR